MILPGHLAVASLAGAVARTDMRGAMAASMFPDLIDKPIRWLFRWTPNDRIPMHSMLGWASSTLVAGRLAGPRFATGWAVGYGAHLACDEVNAHLNPGRIYFWWPFKRYAMHRGPTGLASSLDDFSPASIIVELGVTLFAAWIWFGKERRR